MRALSCGLKWDDLREAARQCEENWDRLQSVPTGFPPPPIDAHAVGIDLESALALRHHCADPDDKLMDHLVAKVVPALAALGNTTDPIDMLQVLAGLPKLSTRNGQAGHWTSADGMNHKLEVCALLESAEDRSAACTRRHRAVGHARAVRAPGGAHVGGGAESTHALVGSCSMTCWCWLASWCGSTPEARQQLHERYTHILIDEFQDTDPIQIELAMYLAAGPAVDVSKDWSELPVDAGRLFFVGDPKQSIYRFRRADIEVFMTTRDRVVGSAKQLVTNFRSRPDIVSWVNAIFGELFGCDAAGMQPAYEALAASDDRGAANPRGMKPVIVLGQTPIDANAEGVRAQQTSDVANAIANMHVEQWPVRHGDAPPTPLRFSDVAILVPTRTGMEVLEDALRSAGVPFRLESSSLVYESQEVRDLLSILRAIDDPTDAVSVVAALRSPAFGCGDDDLLQHVVAGGEWDSRSSNGGDGVVAAALAVLRDYHERRWWVGVSTLIGQVVGDRLSARVGLDQRRDRESRGDGFGSWWTKLEYSRRTPAGTCGRFFVGWDTSKTRMLGSARSSFPRPMTTQCGFQPSTRPRASSFQ